MVCSFKSFTFVVLNYIGSLNGFSLRTHFLRRYMFGIPQPSSHMHAIGQLSLKTVL